MIPDMTEKAIVAAASKLESTFDLLTLLNKIKEDELGDKAYPFKMDHLNYFINPKRNRASYRTFRPGETPQVIPHLHEHPASRLL